eukprot:scaffold25763_cov63-Phaeocystis_antarctica.AAC.3
MTNEAVRRNDGSRVSVVRLDRRLQGGRAREGVGRRHHNLEVVDAPLLVRARRGRRSAAHAAPVVRVAVRPHDRGAAPFVRCRRANTAKHYRPVACGRWTKTTHKCEKSSCHSTECALVYGWPRPTGAAREKIQRCVPTATRRV